MSFIGIGFQFYVVQSEAHVTHSTQPVLKQSRNAVETRLQNTVGIKEVLPLFNWFEGREK
jgi:hypothetical protein